MSDAPTPWQRAGKILLLLWLWGATTLFFTRFTLQFYLANRDAIQSLI